MGYDYYLLIQCEKDGITHHLSYLHKTGSYSNLSQHYFYDKMVHGGYIYNGTYYLGTIQSVFAFEEISNDYKKMVNVDLKQIYDNIKSLVLEYDGKDIIYNDLILLSDKITDLTNELEHYEFSDTYKYELEEYYNKCCELANDGYSNIKVIYGMDP